MQRRRKCFIQQRQRLNVNLYHVYSIHVHSPSPPRTDLMWFHSVFFPYSFSTSNMMILLELKIQFTFIVAKRKCSPIHCGKWLCGSIASAWVCFVMVAKCSRVFVDWNYYHMKARKNNGRSTENRLKAALPRRRLYTVRTKTHTKTYNLIHTHTHSQRHNNNGIIIMERLKRQRDGEQKKPHNNCSEGVGVHVHIVRRKKEKIEISNWTGTCIHSFSRRVKVSLGSEYEKATRKKIKLTSKRKEHSFWVCIDHKTTLYLCEFTDCQTNHSEIDTQHKPNGRLSVSL